LLQFCFPNLAKELCVMTVADQGVQGLILRLHSVGDAFTSRDCVGFEALTAVATSSGTCRPVPGNLKTAKHNDVPCV
jgi:hypothetical protein